MLISSNFGPTDMYDVLQFTSLKRHDFVSHMNFKKINRKKKSQNPKTSMFVLEKFQAIDFRALRHPVTLSDNEL